MAKLHARISSEKGNRVVTMSGNEFITIDLAIKNRPIAKLMVFISQDEDDYIEWTLTDITPPHTEDDDIILLNGTYTAKL